MKNQIRPVDKDGIASYATDWLKKSSVAKRDYGPTKKGMSSRLNL